MITDWLTVYCRKLRKLSKRIKDANAFYCERCIMRTVIFILAGGVLLFAAGCGGNKKEALLLKENEMLLEQKIELSNALTSERAKNKTLGNQFKLLTGLKGERKVEDIYQLERVKILRYTNFYDKDNDGLKETLLVYLQPTDFQGDAVKAPGAMEIELWDLSQSPEEALVDQWQIDSDRLNKAWFSIMGKANYRLAFNIAEKDEQHGKGLGDPNGLQAGPTPLTVKVKFTDYITGKVYNEQKTVDP